MPPFDGNIVQILLWAVIGYSLGSVPFGILVTRALGLGNLREIGSGNIGTTNVLRTGSKLGALATLILDGGKGAVAVLLARYFGSEMAAQVAALAAFVGHCFPVWLGFKGGKGVATFLGILLALAWPVGIAACLTWLATAILSRISSLSALCAAALSPIWSIMLGRFEFVFLCCALAALIFWRHKDNIKRLKTKTEPKIGQK